MPITSVRKDDDALSITVIAEFPVPVDRLWDAYADPRTMERFWGPPEYPATFTRHDMAPGGQSHYFMTGPEGEQYHGIWNFKSVDEHRSFAVDDAFATEPGVMNPDMPVMHMVFDFASTPEGSKVSTVSTFDTLADLEQIVSMGGLEGMEVAMSQMDDVVNDLRTFAADSAANAQILSDTQVRTSRIVRGTPEQVWRAHHEPELLKTWLLGPDGWSMTVADVATNVGDTYRHEWVDANGENGFGFTGELLESTPYVREVTTEQMIGMDGPGTTNELTLTPLSGGTLIAILITYPNAELRDIVLGTGMVGGMEASYARMERELLA